jgi:MFS family permease
LTFGGLLLTAGSVADRLRRRRVLLAGLAVFGLLRLCVVFVTTTGQLIALRAALGVAAAAMAPITNARSVPAAVRTPIVDSGGPLIYELSGIA